MQKVLCLFISFFVFSNVRAESVDWNMITHLKDTKNKSEVDTYILNAIIKDEDLISLFNDSERDYDKFQIGLKQFIKQERMRGIRDLSMYYMLKDYIQGHKLYANYDVFKINVEHFNKKFQAYESCNLREYKTRSKILSISEFERMFQENTNCQLRTGSVGDSTVSEIVVRIGGDLMERGYPHKKSDDFYSTYRDWKLRQRSVMMEVERQREIGKAVTLGAQHYNPNFNIRGDVSPNVLFDFYENEVAFVQKIKAKNVLDTETIQMIAQRSNAGLVTKDFRVSTVFDLSSLELSKLNTEFANKIKEEFAESLKMVFSSEAFEVSSVNKDGMTVHSTVDPLRKMNGYMLKVRNLAIKYPTKEALKEQFKIEVTKANEKQNELTKQGKKDYSVVMFSKMYNLALKMNERNLTHNDELSEKVTSAIAMAFNEVNRVISSSEELAKAENQRKPISVLASQIFSNSLEKNLVSDIEAIKEHFAQVLDMYTWIANVFVKQIVVSKAAAVSTGEIISFDEAHNKISRYLQSTAYQLGVTLFMQKLATDQFLLMRIIPDPEKRPMTRDEFMQLLTGK